MSGSQQDSVQANGGIVERGVGFISPLSLSVLSHLPERRRAYVPGVRTLSVQAQYFRSCTDYESYVEHNIFLADINNERPVKNATYKQNMISLNRFVMIMFVTRTPFLPSPPHPHNNNNLKKARGNGWRKSEEVLGGTWKLLCTD